ncbi:MAG: hypothetical protein KBF37_09875 [Saprospiraceae bacterium]|nr:hypothetical protein [Saprospiraceae bacterium]MBP9210614.1 hypothetical protein [Saprospiraceae bacterium]
MFVIDKEFFHSLQPTFAGIVLPISLLAIGGSGINNPDPLTQNNCPDCDPSKTYSTVNAIVTLTTDDGTSCMYLEVTGLVESNSKLLDPNTLVRLPCPPI